MKSLTHYLLESEQKTYDFRIKIAGIELNNDALDRIEHALQAYDIATMSKPKRLPICTKSLDFPTFGAVEVSIISASLKYPCNDQQIRTALGVQGRFPVSNIVVVPANSPEELRREEDDVDTCDEDETKQTKKKKEALLSSDELESNSEGQPQVGQKRLDTMLKELEKDRTNKIEFEKTEKTNSKTTNELPQDNTSPVAKKARSVKVR